MTTLTTGQVLDLCTRNGINPNAVIFSDERMALPSGSWVATTFGSAWTETKERLQLTRYVAESNDCDDYARMCAGYAQMLHNLTLSALRSSRSDVVQSSLAFGEFWYTPASGAHAINAVITAELELVFLEPQTSQIVKLSPYEIKTCSLLRL